MLRPLLLLLSVLTTLPTVAVADEPLPPGALRRLGVASPARIWTPVGDGEEARSKVWQEERARSIQEVCLGDDGKTVTTRKGDGTVQVWELDTGRLLHRWRLDRDRSSRLSPDGKLVAVAGKDKTLVLHAADTGKVLRRFSRPLPADLGTLAFSADGKTLIAGHFQPAEFSLWDVAAGQLLCWEKSDRDLDFIVAAAVAPDSKVLALGSFVGSLRIWDRGARKLRCRREGYGNIRDVAFSPNGALLASLSSECCIWLWETRDYQPVRRLSWRGLQGSFVVFSPDGKLLACNAGQHVVVWEVASGKVQSTFSGHQGPVTSAAFTADGKRLLTGSVDGSVLVWNLSAPLPPAPQATPVRLDCYGDPLPAAARARLGCLRLCAEGSSTDHWEGLLAFSTDGKRLFVGTPPPDPGFELTDDEARQAALELQPSDSHPGIRVLEVPTGKECLRLEEVPETIDCLALSPDGKTLAALLGSTLYLWDAHTGEKKRMAHTNLPVPHSAPPPATLLTFSPDGRLLAAAKGGQIELLDADSGRCVQRVQGHHPELADLAFSRDGKRLIYCGRSEEGMDGRYLIITTVWDIARGKSLRSRSIAGDSPQGPLRLSSEGGALAAVDLVRRLRLLDLSADGEPRRFPAATGVAFSPDGKLLAMGGRTLRLWDLAANKEAFSLPSAEPSVQGIRFAPDGKLLVARGPARLHFWDLARKQELVPHEGHRASITALACAARGKLLLSGGVDCTLRLWDTAAGRVVRELSGHEDSVLSVALSPDGRQAASLDLAGQVFLWDVATGRWLRQTRAVVLPVASWLPVSANTVAFCGDGQALLIADASGRVRLWQVSSGQELRSFQGDDLPVWPAALSPDGKLLALPGGAFAVGELFRVVETATGAERLRIKYEKQGGKGRFQARAFSPDGCFLVVGRTLEGRVDGIGNGGASQVVLYECSSGKEVLAIDTSSATAMLAFSPDGKKLAAAGKNCCAFRLWDVRTGKLLKEVQDHKCIVEALAFSADGRTLFSADFDGTILAWDVERLTQGQPQPPVHLPPRRLEEAWDDLASADAARAFRAIADLSARPTQVIPFLQARLRHAIVEDPRRIARLIADLDSEGFAVRDKATGLLTETVDQAEPALRRALQDQPALETRQRLEGILRHVRTSPEQRRAWRVCVLLDWLDTPEADRLLGTLADGAADARLTREARAALARRARRRAPDGDTGLSQRERP